MALNTDKYIQWLFPKTKDQIALKIISLLWDGDLFMFMILTWSDIRRFQILFLFFLLLTALLDINLARFYCPISLFSYGFNNTF